MSGEDVPIVDLVGGGVAALVESADRIFAARSDRPMAIIGGLAVTCRCRTMARATADIDAVTGPDGAFGIVSDLGAEELADALEHRRPHSDETTVDVDGRSVHLAVKDGRLIVDDVTIDVIDTHELAPADLEGLDAKQQLFMASHRWALESAQPVRLRVAHRSPDGDVLFDHATLAVATPAALVAMKLHSLQDRKLARPEKAASDTEDLYRLLHEHDTGGLVADAVAEAPYGLPELVLDAAGRMLVSDSLARLRSLRVDGGPSASAIGAADFEFVASEFVDRLSEQIGIEGR
ncbi:MAG: hypothetical protein IVW52_19750 [Acidimicrobiales bacterium]|nr:hypothetical protein [Acidimicrobiales bacterium]